MQYSPTRANVQPMHNFNLKLQRPSLVAECVRPVITMRNRMTTDQQPEVAGKYNLKLTGLGTLLGIKQVVSEHSRAALNITPLAKHCMVCIQSESFVGIGRGNPRVSKWYPYPYPLKPLPLSKGEGKGTPGYEGYEIPLRVCARVH
jgi:hypothetical protein